MKRSSVIVALFAGAVFGVGLTLSGMTDPAKVIGFLDITGAWDPSLAFVMIGAIGVHFVARRFILRRKAPLAAATFDEPKRTTIDQPLIMGAAIFGVGWGLAGYCPGPAIVTLGSGSLSGILFVASMAMGMLLHRVLRSKASRAAAHDAFAARRSPLLPQTDG